MFGSACLPQIMPRLYSPKSNQLTISYSQLLMVGSMNSIGNHVLLLIAVLNLQHSK